MFYVFYSNKTPTTAYLLTDKSAVRLHGNEYFFGRFLKINVRFWMGEKKLIKMVISQTPINGRMLFVLSE